MIAGFGELGEALRRSTVQIRNRRGSGGGSGVVWNTNGLIVTSAHVIGRAEAAANRAEWTCTWESGPERGDR